ncbi:hypothetical protein CBR_g21254 [Chara braunii]|uniref:CCHC-type domain-containing protein n=1 Tax=Chara braunii TaxID=69332 RepID=A0A388L113_CHABU|nr:hypothetical protein CBR_g21254 [Chara braunii]|eukprot:GBG76014.1 hypothetical protein CBR_g21254 [Chara braunii]
MMASHTNLRITDNRSCYNCGQQGHISRYCPLPDRRINGAQSSTSTAIVPAQPLVTAPGHNVGIGTVAPFFSNQFSGDKGWLRNRVATLEEIVGNIEVKHDADEAKELAAKEEAERQRKEKEDEERRLRDKQEREELHLKMSQDLNKQWEMVCAKIDKKDQEANELVKLREDIAKLTRQPVGGAPSTSVAKPVSDIDEVARLKREQEEMRTAADRRFVLLEEKILALEKGKEEAEANAELWKAEALRPGNK